MGLISTTLDWITHPSYDEGTDLTDWFGFVMLALIAAYLWSKVIRNTLK